jgi:hypothetical protein
MTAEPMPAATSAPILTTINPILAVEQAARLAMPVPVGAMIVTQRITTGIPSHIPAIEWSITHFPPEVYSECTIGQGSTPAAALSHLIEQLTPCVPSTPSA